MRRSLFFLTFILVAIVLLIAACGESEPAPELVVAATATTTSTPTPTAAPMPTPEPTTTASLTATPTLPLLTEMMPPTLTPTKGAIAKEELTVAPTPEARVMEQPNVTPTPEAMVMEEPTLTPTPEAMAMEEPTLTPTHEASAEEITPTPEATRQESAVQEFAIIENYAATRFFPREIVVLKGIPVKLYLTRLHREHINRFTISPFFSSSKVILPGEVGLIEFLPDQLGKFKISNVGHNFDATLVVVATMEEARQHFVEKGVKMFALIQSVDDSRVFPEDSFVVKDVPVKVFNISLTADHMVSIAPFYVADDINVRPKEITSFDFTPDITGEFTISNELHGLTGTLIVEEGM